jgi:ParB family protein of integrating conjugative element (PFGI_1 class)
MTSATKTPESLSATARAAQLGQGAGQKVTADDVRARFALAVPKPGNAAAGLKPGDDMDGSTVILPVRSVHFYERNPRVSTNAKYTEIKESVRVQGVTGDLSVTKRPGQDFYVLCAGGNTRLQIVQELLEETSDKRWETLTFRYRAWRGEAWMVAAHLAENHLRSDNTWWEQARGLNMLKEELEQELGRALPAPELHREAKKLGMDFGVTTVRNLLFTFEQLQPIGPWLTAKVVRDTLQPALTGLVGLADTVISDHKQHQAVATQLQDCLRTQAQFQLARAEETDDGQPPPLDVPEVIAALNDSVAGLLGVPAARIPFLLTARSNNPRLTAEELRRLADAPQGPAAGFRAPVVPPEPAEQTRAQQIPLAPMRRPMTRPGPSTSCQSPRGHRRQVQGTTVPGGRSVGRTATPMRSLKTTPWAHPMPVRARRWPEWTYSPPRTLAAARRSATSWARSSPTLASSQRRRT